MEQDLNIKKEGLWLLIENYLRRRGAEDIFFMEEQLQSTQRLISNLNSHMHEGLSLESIIQNQLIYASTLQEQQAEWGEIWGITREEGLRLRPFFLLSLIIVEYTLGAAWDIPPMKQASVFILVILLLSMLLRVVLRWRSFKIVQREGAERSSMYYVYREGEKINISSANIMVGDILFIDFSEKIPVSGVLISGQEISVDETFIGRGTQRKMNLESCLKEIENKSPLQLKIDYQCMTLPSPILLRGSKLEDGSAFKMVVLATDQEHLLAKYTIAIESTAKGSVLEEWIGKISKDLKHISQACFGFLLLFHAFAMAFVVIGLPSGQHRELVLFIVTLLHTLIVSHCLLDASILVDTLKADYLSTLRQLQRAQELQKLLSVEQLLIREENICKYDEIVPKKMLFKDLHEPVDIKLLPAMQERINYHILYEIMGGVGLEKSLPNKISHKSHKNVIVHVNNSQEKIYSSFYENLASIDPHGPFQSENESISELVRHNRMGEGQGQRVNRVIQDPSISDHSFKIRSSADEDREDTERSAKLSQYLNKHCHFSTQNIIEGINKLAKSSSRTYYFQKFSLQRLARVRYLWNGKKFAPIRLQDQEKLLLGIKRLQRQNLIVYLLGIDEGAFRHLYISYLFGVMGVEVVHERRILNKLQKLEKIGIGSLFLIFKNNLEEMDEAQCQHYHNDFIRRGWMSINHHFSTLEHIRNASGRIICKSCHLSKCSCRHKVLELSNVQGFLESTNDVRCIYNLSEEDIEFLEVGFEQLNMTTLGIIERREETEERINQIISCHQLLSNLEDNVSFWVLRLLLVFLFFFPLNYFSFGYIFCKEQLYFSFLYLKLLLVRHIFIGNSVEALSAENAHRPGSRRIKDMIGWAVKGDMAGMMIGTIIACLAVLFNPSAFVQEHASNLHNFSCRPQKSFYHNPSVRVLLCSNGQGQMVVYSKLQTFIFLFSMMAITIKTFVSAQKVTAMPNILFHLALAGLAIGLAYLFPTLLHLSEERLSFIEFTLAFTLAVAAVLLARISKALMAAIEGGKRYQLSLNLAKEDSHNDYAKILAEFKDGQTLQYPYDDSTIDEG